jgi:hypothetical protein
VLDRFFTVLPITSSFLVRFRPVKYRIEALDMLYLMVRGWSVKSYFWSGQRLGQTWSNLPKLQEMYSGPRLKVLLIRRTPIGSTRLGRSCIVLRANTRENLRGKNRVMTPFTTLTHQRLTFFFFLDQTS